MQTRIIILAVSVICIASCNSDVTDKSKELSNPTGNNFDSIPQAESIDSLKFDSRQYAFIFKINQVGDSVFIDADYIQFLTGQAAIDAAVKAHDADTFKTEDGVTHFDVPNDYYIVNENKKIRRLKLALNVKYDLLLDMHDDLRITNSLEGLKKVYKSSPYILSLYNNEIVGIKEQFIPWIGKCA